jgi:hypothetical protein
VPRLAALFLLCALGCEESAPLEAVDAEYTEVLARLHAADRDVARNIHNRDARRRKKIAEKERVAFFRDADVIAAIEQARLSPEGSIERAKGEAYHRHAVFVRSWKDDEKERETELLARIDALAGAEASWSPQDGSMEIGLSGSWATVSMQADDLPAEARADLANEYVAHHMTMVGDDLRELVKLRNQVARREGFETFWHLSLYNQGLTEAEVDALILELEPVVRPVNQAYGQIVATQAESLGVDVSFANDPYLRRQTGLEAGRDESDPYFDTDLAEDRVLASLRSMGIELDGWQVYSGPSRNTRRGAYSFPIRLPRTIALVVSQDRRFDAWQYEAIMHEAAHALRWTTLVPEALASPVLWDPPNAYTEGFAQLFERILISDAWLESYLPEMPASSRDDLTAWRSRHMAWWVTHSIVETAVERRVYEDPNNWEAVARFCNELEAGYGIQAGPVPSTEQGISYCQALHTPLIWHYPAYIQNYLFSYVTEACLYDALVAAVGEPVDNPEVGPWLVQNVTQQGAITPFEERLAALTGKPSRTAALEQYVQAPMVAPAEPAAEQPAE